MAEYKPEYIELLKSHFEDGFGLDTFAAEIDVGRDIITTWSMKHKDFRDALRECMSSTISRQSKFKHEYIQKVQDHMQQGKSFASFAAIIKVDKHTIENWCETIPEFEEAVRIGESLNLEKWEHIGILGTCGKIKGFSAVAWSKNMESRHKSFEQKTKHEITGKDGTEIPIGPQVQIYIPDNGRDGYAKELQNGEKKSED